MACGWKPGNGAQDLPTRWPRELTHVGHAHSPGSHWEAECFAGTAGRAGLPTAGRGGRFPDHGAAAVLPNSNAGRSKPLLWPHASRPHVVGPPRPRPTGRCCGHGDLTMPPCLHASSLYLLHPNVTSDSKAQVCDRPAGFRLAP